MSLDALGRVVVGSGHFMEGAPKALEALGSVLSALDRIVVGGGHDQSFETAKRIGEAVEHFFLPIPAPTPEVIRAPASNVPHYSDFMQQVQHKVREATRAQKIAEATMLADRRSLSLLGEAGADILQSWGYGMAGDYGSAMEKSVDAGVKLGESWWEGHKCMFGVYDIPK